MGYARNVDVVVYFLLMHPSLEPAEHPPRRAGGSTAVVKIYVTDEPYGKQAGWPIECAC